MVRHRAMVAGRAGAAGRRDPASGVGRARNRVAVAAARGGAESPPAVTTAAE